MKVFEEKWDKLFSQLAQNAAKTTTVAEGNDDDGDESEMLSLPGPAFKSDLVKKPEHWFFSVFRPHAYTYIRVAIAALMINLLAMAGAIFIMAVYDRVIPHDAVESLIALTVGMVIVLGFDFVLKALRGWFIDTAAQGADIALGKKLFEKILVMRLQDRDSSAGALAGGVRAFETLRDFFASATITVLIDLPFVALFILVIAMIAGSLAWIPLLAVSGLILAGLISAPVFARLSRRQFDYGCRKHGVLVETLEGLEAVKTCPGAGQVLKERWLSNFQQQEEFGVKSRMLAHLMTNSASTVRQITQLLIVVCGVFMVFDGAISAGALIAALLLSGLALKPLIQMAALFGRFHEALAAYRYIHALMRMPAERESGGRYLQRKSLKGKIEFRNVLFCYPDKTEKTLDHISFTIRPGERVAVLGCAGSGKTTLLRALLGLYEPDRGDIYIDDAHINQFRTEDLRSQIGVVPQDAFLISGTIRDNIALSRPDASDAAILKAAKAGGVHDFISSMPLGYNQPLSEGGYELSAGQRQAVSIARALLSDPSVFVMDEPTAAMDTRTEQNLIKRLQGGFDNKTVLLVTHSPALLSLVDKVMVLDRGRVLAFGSRDEILRQFSHISKEVA